MSKFFDRQYSSIERVLKNYYKSRSLTDESTISKQHKLVNANIEKLLISNLCVGEESLFAVCRSTQEGGL